MIEKQKEAEEFLGEHNEKDLEEQELETIGGGIGGNSCCGLISGLFGGGSASSSGASSLASSPRSSIDYSRSIKGLDMTTQDHSVTPGSPTKIVPFNARVISIMKKG